MKRPLVLLTVLFCFGILFARFVRIPLPLIYSCALILLIFAWCVFKKYSWCEICLLTLAFLSGSILLISHEYLPHCHVTRYLNSRQNGSYVIRGYVVSELVLKDLRYSFILEAEAIRDEKHSYKCCGRLMVYVPRSESLSYGDRVILRGSLVRRLRGFRSQRTRYQDYLANQGIYSIILVGTPSDLLRLNNNKGCALKKFALSLKNKVEKLLSQHLPLVCAAILDAMMLGEKKNIPPVIYDAMVKTGTVHILVVSGFNVGIVTFIITLFLKILRINRFFRFFIATFLLIVYCLITGVSTPVVRATAMAVTFMFAYLAKREPDIYNSCALAALLILSVNPRQLFDVGFQLSFASVISIIYLYPKIRSLLPTCVFRFKYLIDAGLISFSAWLGTMGFIAYYFRIFSPVTVLANLFIVPLASLITLLGASLAAVALICPGLAVFFAATCEVTVSLFLKINMALLKLPFAYLNLP